MPLHLARLGKTQLRRARNHFLGASPPQRYRSLAGWFVVIVATAALASSVAPGVSAASYRHRQTPPTTTTTPPATTTTASSGGVAGNTEALLFDLDGVSYNWAAVAPEYRAIVVNDWDSSWIAPIKAASPSTEVYVYKDISSTRSDDCGPGAGGGTLCVTSTSVSPPVLVSGATDAPYYAGGVGFVWAMKNHPEWFLKDSSGKLIQYAGYPGTYLMDFGNAAYQAQWLANVKADVQSQGFNGVVMDNALNDTNYGTPAEYPTATAIQAATLSVLKAVGPALTAAGITNIANLGYNNLYPNLWDAWLPYVGGLCDQSHWYWGDNSFQAGSYWSTFLEPSIVASASQGKVSIFNVGGSTLTAAQIAYAQASFLLYNDGNQLISWGDGSGQVVPDVALGAATDSAYETSDGIWHRDFANGSVSVNPVAGSGTVTRSS